MKSVVSTLFTLMVFLNYVSVVHAQPEYIGCHHRHNQFAHIELTPEALVARQASIERSDSFDVLHHDMMIDLTGFDQSILRGEVLIYYRVLADSANHFTLDLLDLTIDSITIDGHKTDYSRNGFFVHIELPETTYAGDTNSVMVSYHGTPTVSTGGFGGFYFEGGYAYNLGINLIGEPHNFGRSWFPCFDNFVERATYNIDIVTSKGRKGYAVGHFIGESSMEGDTILRSYEMRKPLPTYLVGVAASNYVEDNYVHNGVFGDVPVQIVAKPDDIEEAKQSLVFLPDAIDCLEHWYGPYVWNRVGYVMTVKGAMEHSSNIAYPAFSVDGGELSTRLMTHELCHHWWGNQVTLNYAPDMWIKEGNAEYGAHLIEEYIGGYEPFREAVRNNHHRVITTAHIDDGDYIALSPLSQENTYGTHTYYRGASMLHNMRQYMGDSLFRLGQTQTLLDNEFWLSQCTNL